MPLNIDPETCDGCGICDEICPSDVLRIDEEKRIARVRFPEDCDYCVMCVLDCPHNSISLLPPEDWLT